MNKISALTSRGKAWAVLVNSDLTEGRGNNILKHLCEKRSTAIRLAKGADVQGSDGEIEEVPIYLFQTRRTQLRLYGPVNLVPPTTVDLQNQKFLDAKEAAIERARKAGLSDEDIAAIGGIQ
jgi:hypothetical protein